jgi:hypothetical protein
LLNLGWFHKAAQAHDANPRYSSDPPPELRNLSKVGSKRGLATTDSDIR